MRPWMVSDWPDVITTSLPAPRAITSPWRTPLRPALKTMEPASVSSTPVASRSMSRPSADVPLFSAMAE